MEKAILLALNRYKKIEFFSPMISIVMSAEGFFEIDMDFANETVTQSTNPSIKKGYEDLKKRREEHLKELQLFEKTVVKEYEVEKAALDKTKNETSKQRFEELDVLNEEGNQIEKENARLDKLLKECDDAEKFIDTKKKLLEIAYKCKMREAEALLKKMTEREETLCFLKERDESLYEDRENLEADKAMFKATYENLRNENKKKVQLHQELKNAYAC